MEVALRSTDIFLEVILLTALLSCLLVGLWLTIFDLGLKLKYKRAITMALLATGSLLVIFFIAHLTAFYPTI
jgi:hypothetical protein